MVLASSSVSCAMNKVRVFDSNVKKEKKTNRFCIYNDEEPLAPKFMKRDWHSRLHSSKQDKWQIKRKFPTEGKFPTKSIA